MNSFRFYDKIDMKEYVLPKFIKTISGEEIDLQKLVGHIIVYSRKRLRKNKRKDTERNTVSN